MTEIIYEFEYFRIIQAGLEIGFNVRDLAMNDRKALIAAAKDVTPVPPTFSVKTNEVDFLASIMGMDVK